MDEPSAKIENWNSISVWPMSIGWRTFSWKMIRFQTKSNINKTMSRELVSLIDLIGYCAVTYLVNKYDIMVMADALARHIDGVALNYDFPITNLTMNKMIEELEFVVALGCRASSVAPFGLQAEVNCSNGNGSDDLMCPIPIRCRVCSVE